MNLNPVIDGLDGPISSANFAMAAAVQRAMATGETLDFLEVQKRTAAVTNMTGLQSAVIKMVHDMVAGIIQKI